MESLEPSEGSRVFGGRVVVRRFGLAGGLRDETVETRPGLCVLEAQVLSSGDSDDNCGLRRSRSTGQRWRGIRGFGGVDRDVTSHRRFRLSTRHSSE